MAKTDIGDVAAQSLTRGTRKSWNVNMTKVNFSKHLKHMATTEGSGPPQSSVRCFFIDWCSKAGMNAYSKLCAQHSTGPCTYTMNLQATAGPVRPGRICEKPKTKKKLLGYYPCLVIHMHRTPPTDTMQNRWADLLSGTPEVDVSLSDQRQVSAVSRGQ